MLKKIILLIAIIAPFALYFFYTWILKFEKKKYPIVKLSIISVVLLLGALIFLRNYENFSPNTKYTPSQYKDGKLIPAENK